MPQRCSASAGISAKHGRLAATLGILLAGPSAAAVTYYVRTDGGSETQCTGRTDAAYPGSGSAQACAWDHPFRALPPGGSPRMAGGDTLLIANGSYQMGRGAAGATDPTACEPVGSWGCYMPPLPSGPDAAHPTRILGAGYASGCTVQPQLWGTERANFVLNLTGTSNAEVACLEITDHSSCVEFHSGALPCQRDTPPYGPWAGIGLTARDSHDVHLMDLNIHGLSQGGVWAGRLTDWTLDRVRIAGNGMVGWDGDIDGEDSNSGALTFRHFTIEWNGCGETYPGGQPTGCWAQSAGGYGDGLGTGATAGNWVFEDSAFLHNTSDGLDLLYARSGSSITLRRVHAEGNAGDQIKTNGPVAIENSIAASSCASFEGQPFTHNVDPCRAGGGALFLVLREGAQALVKNNTITGEGDVLVTGECDSLYSSCNGQERIVLRNNIYIGNTEFLAPDDVSALIYQETFPQGDQVFDIDYSVIRHVKNAACPGTNHVCGEAPVGLANEGIDTFDAHLRWNSTAIDIGTSTSVPGDDFGGRLRDARRDIGAYEWWRRRSEFDGDGRSDLAVYHAASGLWYVRRSSDSVTASLGFGGPGYETVEGDYDGDHRGEHAVYHAATGLWFMRSSASGTVSSVGYGGVGYTAVPRDYDGDGKTDVAVYHAASGLWFVRRSSTGSTWALGYGGPGYAPVPEDYDGDGQTDLAVFHAASGLWFVRRSSTGTTWAQGFGGTGFTPVPRDYDGDGKADLAMYHEASGLWFVRASTTGATSSTGFGGPGYKPVPTDYDGDGHADLAVYHSASGAWFIRSSASGTTSSVAFGGSGFSPVTP